MEGVEEREKAHPDLGVLSPLRIEWSEKVFGLVADTLNRVHKMNEPVRFWQLVSEEHVRAMVTRMKILSQSESKEPPPLFPVNSYSVPGKADRFRAGLRQFRDYLGSRRSIRHTRVLLKEHHVFVAGFGEEDLIVQETGGTVLPDGALFAALGGNTKKRKYVNRLAGQKEDLFEKNVILMLPKILVEHFDSIYRTIPMVEPEKKVFHVQGTFRFTYQQFVIAKYIAAGAKLIWYQDGAFIGEFISKYSRYLAHSVADEYRTWGWKLTEKDVPWKAYPLVKLARKYGKYSGKTAKAYDLMLCYPKFRDNSREYYRELTNQLLSGLNRDNVKNIIARPQPSKGGVKEAYNVDFITDDRVTVSDTSRSMPEEMALSRCVVQMNVPATNFPECIYVDQPVTGILRNDQPTEIIRPHYEFFLREGVLHHGVEAMTDHLNKINIEEWWKEVISKPEYLAYKREFTGLLDDQQA